MKAESLTLCAQVSLLAVLAGGCGIFYGPARDRAGTARLEAGALERVDQRMEAALENYEYVNVALVREGRVVLAKSYGHDRLDKVDVYASVSKPVTATILMRLVGGGVIRDLDDGIGAYHKRYADVMPAEYADSHITFRQLLAHTSGVPHLSGLWSGGKLKLEFRPGSGVMYSSHGYGILGDVMEELTGLSYKRLVKDYIGGPVGAESMTVMHPFFDAPAGQVASTIEDMARFAIGMMDGVFMSEEVLLGEVLQKYAEDRHGAIGLGWYCTGIDTEDVAGYHAGSNGRPRAFLAIKPRRKHAVALTGMSRSERSANDFGGLTIDLMAIIENRQQDAR